MQKNTKIVVFKTKELIYTGIFAALGIALVALLIYMFSPKNDDSLMAIPEEEPVVTEAETTTDVFYEAPAPGVYNSLLVLGQNQLEVSVSVTDNKVSHIDISNITDEVEMSYPLLSEALLNINSQLSGVDSLSEVNIPDDMSCTSLIILDAASRALENAN